MRLLAFTRPVPDSLAARELTHLAWTPVDLEVARAQHAEYERLLMSEGCAVSRLPAAHGLADSVFVEDTVVVLEEVAVITRPGAAARRPETSDMAAALTGIRPLTFIVEPATLDGGDVLCLGRILYVGAGARTNADGIRQLAGAVGLHGYVVRAVEARGCLHLKSAASEVAPGLVLVNPDWIDPRCFRGYRWIGVDPSEPHAANVLRIGETLVCASAYERTNARLEAAGLTITTVEVSELAKAEAGVTCCSVILSERGEDGSAWRRM